MSNINNLNHKIRICFGSVYGYYITESEYKSISSDITSYITKKCISSYVDKFTNETIKTNLLKQIIIITKVENIVNNSHCKLAYQIPYYLLNDILNRMIILKKNKMPYELVETHNQVKKYINESAECKISLDSNQNTILNYLLSVYDKQEKEKVSPYRNIYLNMETGYGKSYVSLMIAYRLRLKTVVICNNTEGLTQFYLIAKLNFTNCVVSDQFNCYDQLKKYKTFEKVANYIPIDNTLPDILFLIRNTAARLSKQFYKNYSFIIIDECHEMCSSTFSNVYTNHTNYRLIMTASANDTELKNLDINEKYFGKCINASDIPGSNINAIIFKGDVKILKYNSDTIINTTRYGRVDYNFLIDQLIINEERNNMIINEAIKLMLEGHNVYVFTKRRAHSNHLLEMYNQRIGKYSKELGNEIFPSYVEESNLSLDEKYVNNIKKKISNLKKAEFNAIKEINEEDEDEDKNENESELVLDFELENGDNYEDNNDNYEDNNDNYEDNNDDYEENENVFDTVLKSINVEYDKISSLEEYKLIKTIPNLLIYGENKKIKPRSKKGHSENKFQYNLYKTENSKQDNEYYELLTQEKLKQKELELKSVVMMGGCDDDTRIFARKEANVIFTTISYSKCSISIEKQTAIILASPVSSNINQIVGRITRKGSDTNIIRKIIDIKDTGAIFNRQISYRKKHYLERGFTIHEY